jgi:hypothetical protein
MSNNQDLKYEKLIYEILRIQQAHRYISTGSKTKLEEIERKIMNFINQENR